MLYRIKFEKSGLSKYISHLDLNRLFMRAINRTGIKIAYSEGFNPHQKLTFGSTLSLGVSSYCEFADIRTEDDGDEKETTENIFKSLSGAMPETVKIKDVYIPDTPLKDIAATRYVIYTDIGSKATERDLREMFSQDISIEKKSKTKTEQVLINKYIEKIDFEDSDENSENKGYMKIDAIVKTGNDMYLNPEYIIKAISEKFEVSDYFIVKLDMFDKNGAEFR